MLKRNAAVVLVTVLVVGAGAYAWAAGPPLRPGPVTGQAPPGPAAHPPDDQRDRGRDGVRGRHRGGAGYLHRAISGEVLVPKAGGEGFETVVFDRGKITSAGADRITLERPDGQSVTRTLDGATRFRGADGAGELKVGEPAVVVAKEGSAVMVAQLARRVAKPPKSPKT